jgi:Fe-S protein assembly co-chaperone HscB
VHPDLKNDERGCSEVVGHGWSSALNKAYSILKDPLSRGISLIQNEMGDENFMEKMKLNDQGFLTEILEAREKVEESSNEGELGEIRNEITGDQSKLLAEIETKIDVERNFEAAGQLLMKLKYLKSLEEAIKEKI